MAVVFGRLEPKMERRGFLKTLAGLTGAVAVPTVPVIRVARVEQTHFMPLPMQAPCDEYLAKFRHVDYGCNAVVSDGSIRFEMIG